MGYNKLSNLIKQKAIPVDLLLLQCIFEIIYSCALLLETHILCRFFLLSFEPNLNIFGSTSIKLYVWI